MLLIPGARLGQTYGYRRVFLLGVGLFTVASLLCGLAPNPITLVLARILQGLGAALMFPQTLTDIQLNFDGDERIRAIGLYAIALSTGAIVGQLLGGMVISADLAGTQWWAIFLVNVPVGLLVVLAGLRYLPPDAQRIWRRLDLVGSAVLCVALMLVAVAPCGGPRCRLARLDLDVSGAGRAGDDRLPHHPATDRCSGRGTTGRRQYPGRPAISWALVTLMTATGTYYALLFTVAQYLQRGLGRQSEPVLVVLLGVGGLGLGVQFSTLIAHLTATVPAHYTADISGVSTTIMQISGAVSIAVFGTLYLGLTAHATTAFGATTAAFAVAALTATLAAHRATRPVPKASPGQKTPVPAVPAAAGR